jgi:hypothetical protein
MGETCSMHGREKYISQEEILKERDESVELGLGGWIIIQYALNKLN